MLRFLLLALLTATSLASRAASPLPLPAGVTLGVGEFVVRAAIPELERVRHVRRSPTGAIGSWRNPMARVGAGAFEEVFYFDANGLSQVEWTLLPQDTTQASASAFDEIVARLRAQYGMELAARSSTPTALQQSASWVVDDEDIIATRSGSAEAPTVRIVWRARATKDASQL